MRINLLQCCSNHSILLGRVMSRRSEKGLYFHLTFQVVVYGPIPGLNKEDKDKLVY